MVISGGKVLSQLDDGSSDVGRMCCCKISVGKQYRDET